jgi:hypothetical protein|nr:MAG TPA_asm: hypothetical protein [Caudoviricetes sp.]
MYQNPYSMGMQYPYNMQSYNNQNLNNLNNMSTQNNLVPQELIRVNGLQGAQTYQMAPNSTVALFDGNSDIMYIKQTDGAGFGNIRKFSFTEILDNQQVSQPSNDFVSREEFENFKKEMMDYGKQFVQQDFDTIKSKSNNVKR